jgi:uncharacterized protein
MHIEHDNTHPHGYFHITEAEERLALLTYSWGGPDDRILIEHTEVSQQLNGQGVGKQLVTAAVQFAREQGIKIVPLCPFAKSVFERNPQFRDVL